MAEKSIIPIEKIITNIFLIRNEKVILDSNLASLYGVETKILKRAVRRNIERFPEDFMFELTQKEFDSLRSQSGTLKRGQHSKYLPFVFTEQGVAMLSSVLQSKQAIEVNVAIIRAFVQLRKTLDSNIKISQKIKELELTTNEKFKNHDNQISIIFDAIKQLIREDEKPKRKIGY